MTPKNKIFRYLAYAVLLLGYGSTGAQSVPGYLGKKWSLSYTAALFPSFANPNSTEVSYAPGSLEPEVPVSLNLQHHIHTGFALSKNLTLGLDLGYLATATNPYPGIYIATSNGAYDLQIQNYAKTTAFSYGFNIKYYTRHYAPLGFYWEYKLGLINYAVRDIHYRLLYENTDTAATISGSRGNGGYIGTGAGINRVIRDRILVSFGFESVLFLSNSGDELFPLEYNTSIFSEPSVNSINPAEGNTLQNREALRELAEGRLLVNYLLNFKIRVGILL